MKSPPPSPFGDFRRHDGQQGLDPHVLRDGALELVVDEVASVEVLGRVLVDDEARDLAGALDREVLEHPGELVADVRVAATQVVATLAADDREADLDACRLELAPAAVRGLGDARVERAREAAVARDDHEHDVLLGTPLEQRVQVSASSSLVRAATELKTS
jgi:hypothetical protein